MKHTGFNRFALLLLILAVLTGLLSAQDKDAEKIARIENKLEMILGTETNWKPTILKNLRYEMSCKDVTKIFPNLQCNDFKKYDFPKVPGKILSLIQEYQFTFNYGKLESVTIIFGSKMFDTELFATALMNVAQKKWGALSPEKLKEKYVYWYNTDRDSVLLTLYNGNWQIKVSMPKHDTGDVTAGTLSEDDIRIQLARLLGSSKSWVIPAMSKFKKGMSCAQIAQVYKTMTGCDPNKSYSWGVVTIKEHPLVHILKFTFDQGKLKSATIIFHRQLDKELFKKVSQDLFQAKWGQIPADKLNQDILTIYESGYGVAQRMYSQDHWEIKHDFPN